MGWRVPEDSGAPTYLLSGLVQHGNGNVWAMGVVMGVGCCFGLDGAVECCCGCWEEWSSLLFLDLPSSQGPFFSPLLEHPLLCNPAAVPSNSTAPAAQHGQMRVERLPQLARNLHYRRSASSAGD